MTRDDDDSPRWSSRPRADAGRDAARGRRGALGARVRRRARRRPEAGDRPRVLPGPVARRARATTSRQPLGTVKSWVRRGLERLKRASRAPASPGERDPPMNLGRPDRAARLDALAAAYALGTLGAARATTARPRRASATPWSPRRSARLGMAPRRAGRRRARHHAAAARLGRDPGSRLGLVRSAGDIGAHRGAPRGGRASRCGAAWRFAGFALAFALGVTMLAPRAERPFESVVVVLAGPDAKPALVATAERGSRYLTVKARRAGRPSPADRALELWMLPDGRPRCRWASSPRPGIDRVALRRAGGRRVPGHPGARRQPRAGRRLADRRADRAGPVLRRRRATLLTGVAGRTRPYSVSPSLALAEKEGPDANVRPFARSPAVGAPRTAAGSAATRRGRRPSTGTAIRPIVLPRRRDTVSDGDCPGSARRLTRRQRAARGLGAGLVLVQRPRRSTAGADRDFGHVRVGVAGDEPRTLAGLEVRRHGRRQGRASARSGRRRRRRKRCGGIGIRAVRVHGLSPGSVLVARSLDAASRQFRIQVPCAGRSPRCQVGS